MKKRWGAGLLAAAMLFCATPATEAAESITEDVYQWVQSTARQNYYFNKQQIYFGVDALGQLDADTLIVPVLKTYDNVQIQDVVSKRRWKMQSTKGYGDLVGAAEYLRFNLKENTVKLQEHDDLDSDWGTLEATHPNTVISLQDTSNQGVDGKFYQAILKFARQHADEISERTRVSKKAVLTEESKKKIELFKDPNKKLTNETVKESVKVAEDAAKADTTKRHHNSRKK